MANYCIGLHRLAHCKQPKVYICIVNIINEKIESLDTCHAWLY